MLTTLVLSVAAIGLIGLIDFGTRESVVALHQESRQVVVERTADYLLTSLGAVRTGAMTEDPARCTICHTDTDGTRVDMPATRCPEGAVVPDPPIDVAILDVDATTGRIVPTGEAGNGVRFRGSVVTSPGTIPPAVAGEVRTIRPVVDPQGDGWMLVEDVDRDLDGTLEVTQPVAYGIGNVSFRLIRRPGPVWEAGAHVSAGCSNASCHGTGGAGGRDIVGSGSYAPDSPGEVWQGRHPLNQGVVGVEVTVQASPAPGTVGNTRGDRTGQLRPESLTGVAYPRRR